MTEQRDRLDTQRRNLPMVEIAEDYRFEGPDGVASSRDMFEGRMGDSFFDTEQPLEMPGCSCFLLEGDTVYHTYSQYARGLESTGGSYYFLDLTALGFQEDWEEPKGRSERTRGATPDFAS